MKSALVKSSTALIGAILLSGCQSMGIRDHRGAVIDQELVAAIQPGVDNKQSVERTLGRPSFIGQFNQNDWYYVSRDTKSLAFRGPAVLDQSVVHVRFDAAGNVVAVNRTGKELIASIDPESAETPTLGRERSFFDELFGGIGTVGSGVGGTARPDR